MKNLGGSRVYSGSTTLSYRNTTWLENSVNTKTVGLTSDKYDVLVSCSTFTPNISLCVSKGTGAFQIDASRASSPFSASETVNVDYLVIEH